MSVSHAALITGCSSGIGRATALRLHAAGLPVYATARHVEDLSDLAAKGVTTLALDLTDAESMDVAVKRVSAEHGAVGILVNNAGYAALGTIEEIALDDARVQLETNVLGPARLIQLVLPGMREQHFGRIINLSSMYGRFAVPGTGIYNASKYALEGLSDALRLEVAQFGIRVSLIEPGPVRTHFATAALATLDSTADSPYPGFNAKMTAWYTATYHSPQRNLAGRFAVSTDDVARVITRVACHHRPRARYPVGNLAKMLLTLRRFTPDPMFDDFVRAQFPVP
jgi:NAD(P)-dependent dehydrogenase (short-subunit alcohol dehydrogenase family)